MIEAFQRWFRPEPKPPSCAFSSAWRRYVEIRRAIAGGAPDAPNHDSLKLAWGGLAQVLGVKTNGFPSYHALREMALRRSPENERAQILADIDFLVADTTVARLDESLDEGEIFPWGHKRSNSDATFGNFLDRG
jgi:hypothetical protein